MTRQEHLSWCKQRAHEYLAKGDVQNAVVSMMSDLGKHEETKMQATGILSMMGLQAAASNNIEEARRYIDGFN